jgi:hypothetical protein
MKKRLRTKFSIVCMVCLYILSCKSPTQPMTPSRVPTLYSPEEGAILDNGRMDRKDFIKWRFIWGRVVGASKYNLYVKHVGSYFPIINTELTDFNRSLFMYYDFEEYGSYIANKNRFNWRWKVRAYVDEAWWDWSEERSFDVEPVNTDLPIDE